jgi:hypothetical protein
MTAAMRTVFMFSFGRDALMPEDYYERPVLWPQFKIAMREQLLLETTAVNPPAEILEF